jgi:glycosyltransferase 2 family protein
MKRLISLVVSLLLLALIYWKIDTRGLVQVLQNCNGVWMAISLSMVAPLTLLTAWRLQLLMPTHQEQAVALPIGEANRLILAACTLNMVLPSKMGDIAKAYFMRDRGHLDGSLSLSLVVFEKACDMLSLLLWCAVGLVLYPQKGWLFGLMTIAVVGGLGLGLLLIGSGTVARKGFAVGRVIAPRKLRIRLMKLQAAWETMHDYFWRDRQQLWRVSSLSVLIWFLHLLQIWFFILALNAWTPFLINLALAPLAILAGLLPLTFAGVGTRDAALITLYQSFFTAPTAAALGLLCTSRYVLPAIAGLPFLGHYLALIRTMKKQPQQLP